MKGNYRQKQSPAGILWKIFSATLIKIIHSRSFLVTTTKVFWTKSEDFFRSSYNEVFQKRIFRKTQQNSQENPCIGVSFFKKRDSNRSVFLWIFQNFPGQLFFQNVYGPLFFWSVDFVIIRVNGKNWSALTNIADQKISKIKP